MGTQNVESWGKKDPVLSWNVLNLTTWRGDMRQNCIFEDKIELWVVKMLVLGKKRPSFVLEFFKSDYMERIYGVKTEFQKIR